MIRHAVLCERGENALGKLRIFNSRIRSITRCELDLFSIPALAAKQWQASLEKLCETYSATYIRL